MTSRRVTFEAETDLLRQVKDIANESDLSMAQFIRAALREKLARSKNKRKQSNEAI